MDIRTGIRMDTVKHTLDTHTLTTETITTATIKVTRMIIIQNLMDTMAGKATTTAITAITIMIIQDHVGITAIGTGVKITATAKS